MSESYEEYDRNRRLSKCFANVLIGNKFNLDFAILTLRNLQETNRGYRERNLIIRQNSNGDFVIDVEFLL